MKTIQIYKKLNTISNYRINDKIIDKINKCSIIGVGVPKTGQPKGKIYMIERLLLAGEENAISTTQLMKITKLSKRKIAKHIQAERIAGAPILATKKKGGGYFLPENDEEMEKYIKMVEHTAKMYFVAIKKMRQRLKG